MPQNERAVLYFRSAAIKPAKKKATCAERCTNLNFVNLASKRLIKKPNAKINASSVPKSVMYSALAAPISVAADAPLPNALPIIVASGSSAVPRV